MTPDLFAVAVQRTLDAAAINRQARSRIAFNVTEGEDVRTITPAGRDAWALGELITAGAAGCTPIDNPGPRWSGYVYKLEARLWPQHRDHHGNARRRVCRQARSIRPALARCTSQIPPTLPGMGATNERPTISSGTTSSIEPSCCGLTARSPCTKIPLAMLWSDRNATR